MKSVSLAEAKARLSALIGEAEAGQSVRITRHGKPVARLVPEEKTYGPIDTDALRRLTETMPRQAVSAGEFIRQMRDTDRY